MPVGISFYIFQAISYIVDIYRDNIKAERNVCLYAAYIAFFPQLVAGPIERSTDILPQLKNKRYFSYENAMLGMQWIGWGLFEKVIVADTFAVYVDKVYENVYATSGLAFIIATFLFTFQIYADFSGYSNIARGTAKLFGIELMENFKSPYFSASLKEFWGRWHISLSTWFRDYIYIPLGGNRKGKLYKSINLFLTMILSGLWHGASGTFILWGGVHAVGNLLQGWLWGGEEKDQSLSDSRFCILE